MYDKINESHNKARSCIICNLIQIHWRLFSNFSFFIIVVKTDKYLMFETRRVIE